MSEWISVKDRLPQSADLDTMGRILVWNEFSGFSHLLHVDHLLSERAYTHWMHLPRSPSD